MAVQYTSTRGGALCCADGCFGSTGVCVVTVSRAPNALNSKFSTTLCRLRIRGGQRTQSANSHCDAAVQRCGTSGLTGCAVRPSVSSLCLSNKECPFIHPRGHRDVEESHHHFIVGLLAPANRRCRVRVVGIAGRVIEPSHRLQLRSRLQHARLRKSVAHLPVKVIVHSQQWLKLDTV